jgi:hypothetical protein
LQVQPSGSFRAARWVQSRGQCSSGALAFSLVGHPQPSSWGTRSIFCRNGRPQYETPCRTTRKWQLSHRLARRLQSVDSRNIPICRSCAAADLAAARLSAANTLPQQERASMRILSATGGVEGERLTGEARILLVSGRPLGNMPHVGRPSGSFWGRPDDVVRNTKEGAINALSRLPEIPGTRTSTIIVTVTVPIYASLHLSQRLSRGQPDAEKVRLHCLQRHPARPGVPSLPRLRPRSSSALVPNILF